MREIFKPNNIFWSLLILVVFSHKINAQTNENEPPPGFDNGEQLNEIPIPGYQAPDDSWDHASNYWNTEPNNNSTYDDEYYAGLLEQIVGPKQVEKGPRNQNSEDIKNGIDDRQTESKVILTKKVLPGETHTQNVKVLRDPNTSTEKKVIDLIVNGMTVGKITFSVPLTDKNGINIYSKMTVEVFRHCPVAITNVTFYNPNTSTFQDSQHSTNGNLANAKTELSMYQTLGIINFASPINEEENIVLTGSTTAANFPDNKKDPCIVAKELTTLATNQTYQKAVLDIKNASADKLEHSVTLGKTNGQITASPMVGDSEAGEVGVNYNWPGAFTVLHNHPNDTPPSADDIYAITRLNKNNSNFNSCFALTGGSTYAIAITDLAAAQEFSAKYLANKKEGDPEYPTFMRDEMIAVWEKMGSFSIEAEAKAKAFVVNKYNGGITFFKQNSIGVFYPLISKETKHNNGLKTYTLIPCI